MKVKSTTKLMTIALIPIAFTLSYYLLSYYTNGDQIPYHRFYTALYGANIGDVMLLAYHHVSSREPLSTVILWIGSNLGIEKNIYISLLNVILIVSLFLLARRYHVKRFMICLLLTNFYVVVLMTGAERLKISYIILILASLFAGKVRLLFLTISPLAHLQSFILLSGVVLSSFEGFIKNLIFRSRLTKRALKLQTFVFILGGTLVYFMFDSIWSKGIIYIQKFSPFGLIKIGILFMIALYVTRKRFRMFLLFLPSITAVAILGGNRVNMIPFTLVIYYLMEERRLHHPLIYLLMAYFSIKTIPFIQRVILYGDGFVPGM
jgi:hypothetical protein